MKKVFCLLLGVITLGVGICFGFNVNSNVIQANAGDDTTLVEEEKGVVVIEKATHGTITTSITEGKVGDTCVITAKHDLLYKVDFVKVNGVSLIESETVSGEYSFVLVAGNNVITSHFIVDEALCGELTEIIKQLTNKDWTNLFSVTNVLTLIGWLLEGGLFIAIIKYYIKDKKLEKKLENSVRETMQTVVAEDVKKSTLKAVEEIITPIFKQSSAMNEELKRTMNTFSKCFALMQENTPESRRAVLDELSGLKLSDKELISEIQNYIEKVFEDAKISYQQNIESIKNIKEENQNIIGKKETENNSKEKEVSNVDATIDDDGTRI